MVLHSVGKLSGFCTKCIARTSMVDNVTAKFKSKGIWLFGNVSSCSYYTNSKAEIHVSHGDEEKY